MAFTRFSNVLSCRNVLEGEESGDKRMTCTVNLLVSQSCTWVSGLPCWQTLWTVLVSSKLHVANSSPRCPCRISTRMRSTDRRCTSAISTSCVTCTYSVTTTLRLALRWNCMLNYWTGVIRPCSMMLSTPKSKNGIGKRGCIARSLSILTRGRLVWEWNLAGWSRLRVGGY